MINININQVKPYGVKLQLVSKADQNLNQFINKNNHKITLISELKTYFFYLDDKNSLTKNQLRKLFLNLAREKFFPCDIDIDVKSFTNKKIKENSALQIIYEALAFGGYNAYSILAKTKPNLFTNVNLISQSSLADNCTIDILKIQNEAINNTRDLQDTPPNLMYPEIFANKIVELAKDSSSKLKVTILDQKAIKKEKMNLLLAVNAGSYEEARVVVLEYTGDAKNKEVTALIGKGITFDSGGYSLKPSSAMKGMKFDMSGAAIVCNTAIAAARLNVKTNFVAVACLTENRIGGKATLVESVIPSMNGKTVEINNTDAEGRLVLADGITYAIRKANASKIIDVSTLTGAILIALGKYMTGVFATDDQFYQCFATAAEQANEEIWRMPIHEQNFANMKTSVIADLSNVSKNSYGGSSNAAAFLAEFCENKPFIHLDVAGTAEDNGRGQAVMVKTLLKYLLNEQK